jgi:2'-5' RNA ligase
MRLPNSFRYFLASHPDRALRASLVNLRTAAGQHEKIVKTDQLHLTWFVITEPKQRDCFILPRVQAVLADRAFAAGPLRLGRVVGGDAGAALYARGRKPEILALYRELVACFAARGLHPMHRKSGLNPHFTLGHDSCAFEAFRIMHEWIPDELLLIESEVGNGVHNVLGRWPLLPPRQGTLPFDPAIPPAPFRAAGG